MPSKDQHTIVIPPDVWDEIEKRMSASYGGASATIATMLRRYIALLAESRMRNRDTFTPDELMFLRDELKDAHTGQSLEDALIVYAEQEGDYALYDRIATLSSTDKIGLLDSVERSRIEEQRGKRIEPTKKRGL